MRPDAAQPKQRRGVGIRLVELGGMPLGLEIATSEEARQILDLKGGDRVNF
jgi:hypothetical protein